MPHVQLEPVLRHVRTLAHAESMKTLADGELVRRFAAGKDEAAFAEMMRRYGPMVQSTCRRVLGHEQDAEDAFQATFLVLARRCGAIRQSQSAGAWIYQVAQRIALKARRDLAKRRARQEHSVPPAPAGPVTEAALRELQSILHEEVSRLPEKYRAPFLLCCLEGKSGADAACQLGWKEGTVSGRLTVARKLLRSRLARRGVTLPAALCVAYLSQSGATASVPAHIAQGTLKAALAFAAGRAPASGLISSQALGLASGLLRALAVVKLMGATTVLLVVSLLGLGLAARHTLPAGASPPPTAQPKKKSGKAPDVPPRVLAAEPQVRLDRFGDPLPPGALARFGTVRWRQGWMASRVLFSPDGKKLALAGYGRPLGLWDLATGKEIRQFHQRDIQASGVAFSPDGTLLAEGDVAVRLWDTNTGALRRVLPSGQQSQRAVVFTPDGKTVISGGHDNLIHLWDVQSGEYLAKLEGHTSSVLTLAVTNDGATLASAGSDRVIRLWDLAARKQIRQIKGLQKQDSAVEQLVFSPDGRSLASVEWEPAEKAPARVWDTASGKERYRLEKNASPGRAVAFADDGTLIASGHADGAVRLWDPASGRHIRHWNAGAGVRSLAFSPDSKRLATTSVWESAPRLWDVASGSEIHPSDSHRGMIAQICLSQDARSLVSLGRDQQLIQWDLAARTPRKLAELPLGQRWTDYYHRLSPDGRLLAQSAGVSKSVTLLDAQAQKPVKGPVYLQDEPYFLRFSPDGQILAIGGQNGGLYLWNWQAGAGPRRIQTPEKDLVTIYLFLPDGKQVVTGSRSPNNVFIHLWDVASGRRLFSFPGNNSMPTCAVSPDGKWGVGAGFGDSFLHVIDIVKRREVRTIPLPEPASGLAFSPDGRILAYGQYERSGGRIGLLDFATGQPVVVFQGHHSGVAELLFSGDGRYLFSGAGDSTIMQWDATGRLGKRPFYANLKAAWDALSHELKEAYPARWDLLDAPSETIALFRRHAQPVKPPDTKAFQKLVSALDSGSFGERQKAAAAIKAAGLAAEPLLRRQLKGDNSLEARKRLLTLLDELTTSASWRRTQAVVPIAAAIGTEDARRFLGELAAGDPDALLTSFAKKALAR